jgi:outer membrane protein OmpA-like peptidoglycan-associated protein
MTYDREYPLAAAQSMPHIDLEVYFDFDSTEITPEAEGRLANSARPWPTPS